MPKNKAQAVIPDDQLSLAIGKDGQNVRLAAKLTGWKIDVRSVAQVEEEQKTGKITKRIKKADSNETPEEPAKDEAKTEPKTKEDKPKAEKTENKTEPKEEK